MGMAASQARLLTLTARLHDVEFEAQTIQNAKLKLADTEDAIYQKYLDALDATQITGKIMNGIETSQVFATFDNLCGGWENMILKNQGILAYGLVNQKTGKLYVDEEMYNAYNEFQGTDSDEFALKQLGYSEDEISAYIRHRDTKGSFYNMPNSSETSAATKIRSVDTSLGDTYSPAKRYFTASVDDQGVTCYKEVTDMGNYLTTNADGSKTFNENATALFVSMDENDTNEATATIVDFSRMRNELISEQGQYYKNTFEMIKNRGECEVLEAEYQNNSEWLTNMVAYGNVGIYTLAEDEAAPRGYKMEMTSTSTNTILSDTAVSSMDNTELKKAEAEYNKELKKINKKDTMYDLELEKLETERSAITTEMDSLRTVIDENIDRTFGTFG